MARHVFAISYGILKYQVRKHTDSVWARKNTKIPYLYLFCLFVVSECVCVFVCRLIDQKYKAAFYTHVHCTLMKWTCDDTRYGSHWKNVLTSYSMYERMTRMNTEEKKVNFVSPSASPWLFTNTNKNKRI